MKFFVFAFMYNLNSKIVLYFIPVWRAGSHACKRRPAPRILLLVQRSWGCRWSPAEESAQATLCSPCGTAVSPRCSQSAVWLSAPQQSKLNSHGSVKSCEKVTKELKCLVIFILANIYAHAIYKHRVDMPTATLWRGKWLLVK